MTVSNDDLVRAIIDPIHKTLASQGITPLYLAKKLKRELNAKEIKVFKNSNPVDGGDVIYSKPLVSWGIRQKAREDAQKLLDLYPAEKHVFPDKDGNPQDISGLSNLEAATRLAHLISEATKRKKEANGNSGGKNK